MVSPLLVGWFLLLLGYIVFDASPKFHLLFALLGLTASTRIVTGIHGDISIMSVVLSILLILVSCFLGILVNRLCIRFRL